MSLVIRILFFSMMVVHLQLMANDRFHSFEQFSPSSEEICVGCEKTADLAEKTHQAISELIKKEQIDSPEILDAADRLGGLIVITHETITKNMSREDCPSLADYELVFEPKERPTHRQMILSKDIPLSAVKAIGLSTTEGSRYFFKGTLGGEEILVEVVAKRLGRAVIRYYRVKHDELQAKYADLPDLGSSKINQQSSSYQLPSFKEELNLGGFAEAKGEVSLKDKNAAVTVKNKKLGAGAQFKVDHTGKSHASLDFDQDAYNLQLAQQYTVSDDKKTKIDSEINVQAKMLDAAAAIKFEGEEKRGLKLEKGLEWLETDILISGYYLETNKGKELKRSVEVGSKDNGKLFSFDMENKENVTVSFPTRLNIWQAEGLELKGDNSIGTKGSQFRYTVVLNRDELFTYDIKTKKNSEYRKQSLEKKIKWDNSLGRLDFKLQNIEGAVESDKEVNETSLWITVHRRF